MKNSIIGFCALVILLIVGTYIIHLVLPETMRWLSVKDTETLKEISVAVVTGVFISLSILYLKNRSR